MGHLSSASNDLLAPLKGIVFDKDGTLADLDARWVPFFEHILATLAQVGADPEAEQTLAEAIGIADGRIRPGSVAAIKSADETLAFFIGHLVDRGWDRDQALAAYEQGCRSAPFGPLQPIGDVPEALSKLSAAGYRLGVATSDDRANTVAELAELGIADLISATHCGDDGDAVKPEPEVLWGICRQWELPTTQVLFVGDSTQDLDTATAAGCRFVAVSQHQAGATTAGAVVDQADAWVRSASELADAFTAS